MMSFTHSFPSLGALALLFLAAGNDVHASRCKPSSKSLSESLVLTSASKVSSSIVPSALTSSTPEISSSSLSSIVTVVSSTAAAPSSSEPSIIPSSTLVSSSTAAAPSSSAPSVIPSSTLVSSSAAPPSPSSSPAEIISTTSTSVSCNAVPTYIGYPETCWVDIPKSCSPLNATPTIRWPQISPTASMCRGAFLAGTTTPPVIAACFTNIASSQFVGASAWKCVTEADVYCKFTTAPCGSPPPPAPTNVLANAGFESGSMSSWTRTSELGADSVINVAVVAGSGHGGSTFSLKAVFDNSSGGSRTYTQYDVKLEAGAEYEASWWWYSTNSAAATVTRMQFVAGSASFVHDVVTTNQPTGQWIQTSKRFRAATSFATVRFSMYGNRQGGANTFYADDISIIKVVE